MNLTLKNTIFYSLGEVLPKIISFLLLPVYTLFLSPTDYGIISYTTTITTFLNVIGILGLNSYVLRYYFIHKDEESRKKVLGTAFLAIGIFNAFLLGLSYIFMPYVISQYEIQVAWNPFFKLTLITNFLSCFSTIPLCLYRIQQKANKFVLLNISRTIFSVLMNLLFLVVLRKGINGYFYANLISALPFVPIYLLIISKYSSFSFSVDYLKEGLKFSLPLVPGTLAFVIINMSDRIILERNVELSQIGLYNIAVTMSSTLNIVISSGYHAFEPDIFAKYGDRGYYDFVQKVQKVYYSSIYLMGFLISLFSQEVFYFFTSEKFHESYIYVPILIFTAMISGQQIIYSAVLQGDRKTKTIGIVTIIGACTSVILNLLLVPLWGVWAAAATGALSMTTMNLLEYVTMRFPGKSIWREIILSLLVPFLTYLVFYISPDLSWQGFLLKLISILVFMFSLRVLYSFKFYDFQLLLKKN